MTNEKEQELTEQQLAILEQFSDEDRHYAINLIGSIDPDELSFDSLKLFVDEMKLLGGIDSNLMRVSRENNDLRARLKKERSLSLILGGCVLISVIVIAFQLYLFTVFPKYKVIQTIDNSVICEIKPENNPTLTVRAIEEFASLAVVSSYSFSYINYRDEIGNATSRFFTDDGRAAFNRALRVSGSLNHIINNNLIMKTSVISAAQLEEKGIDNKGRHYWIVKMPILTEFFTGQAKAADSQTFVAKVRIVTTDRDAFNTKGIGVSSLTLHPYKPSR